MANETAINDDISTWHRWRLLHSGGLPRPNHHSRLEDLRHGLWHDGRDLDAERPRNGKRRPNENRMPHWTGGGGNRWIKDAKVCESRMKSEKYWKRENNLETVSDMWTSKPFFRALKSPLSTRSFLKKKYCGFDDYFRACLQIASLKGEGGLTYLLNTSNLFGLSDNTWMKKMCRQKLFHFDYFLGNVSLMIDSQ